MKTTDPREVAVSAAPGAVLFFFSFYKTILLREVFSSSSWPTRNPSDFFWWKFSLEWNSLFLGLVLRYGLLSLSSEVVARLNFILWG